MRKRLAILLSIIFAIIIIMNVTLLVKEKITGQVPDLFGYIPVVALGYVVGTDIDQGDLFFCKKVTSENEISNKLMVFKQKISKDHTAYMEPIGVGERIEVDEDSFVVQYSGVKVGSLGYIMKIGSSWTGLIFIGILIMLIAFIFGPAEAVISEEK